MRKQVTLLTLLVSLVLSACNMNTAAPETPTQAPETEPEEAAVREVYTMTVGDGLVGQEITKRSIKMASAVTSQDTENLSIDAGENLLYINAERADLAALAESEFLKNAVDNSVPVIVESEAAQKLNDLLGELFGFELPEETAVLISRTETGIYSALPIGGENAVEDILSMALEQGYDFKYESTDPSGSNSTAGIIETQQGGKGDWVGGPNAVATSTSAKYTKEVWTGNGAPCPARSKEIENATPCQSTLSEDVTVSTTWSVSAGGGYTFGLDNLFSIVVDSEYTKGRTETTTQTFTRTAKPRPGKIAYPVFNQRVQDEEGYLTGTRRVTASCEGDPRGGLPNCGQTEKITEADKGQFWYSVTYPVSPQFGAWRIEDCSPAVC